MTPPSKVLARPLVAIARRLVWLTPLALAGCGDQQFWILRPRGPVASASLHALIVDVAAMLLIIGPTTLLVAWCIWRYRHGANGRYTPRWESSLPIEILSWGLPLAIVAFLSYVSFVATFQVNPFAPGVMASGGNPDANRKPVNVDVITTDWQWLFIYPDLHVAAANELVIPVHTPVRFRMTSATVSNDILIPQLMGQIDLMPGMVTRQGLIADYSGTYQGLAADFNGPGFSWMQFKTRVVSDTDYARWVASAQQAPRRLDMAAFERFAVPTINQLGTVTLFSHAEDGILDKLLMEIMAGKTYPTPPEMTEKMVAQTQGRGQPIGPASPN